MKTFTAAVSRAGYGALTVLEELEARVETGKVLAVLGSNGAGKSTALQAIVGTVRCERRRVEIDGEEVSRLASWALPMRGIVFVPDGARAFVSLTVLENLVGASYSVHGREPRSVIDGRLQAVSSLFPVLGRRIHQLAGTLSGGERQMLALGRALMTDPSLLILDEPSAGLAPVMVEELFAGLRRIKSERGVAMILAEQNARATASVADMAMVLDQGRVVLTGAMQDVMQDPSVRQAYLGI